MAKITFLGTSASVPCKNRDNTSFVFQFKKQSFLIDCPGSPTQKLLKANYDYTKIKNIIITHHHPDHLYGIIPFIHTQAFQSLQAINIYTSATSKKVITKLINLFKLDRKHFPQINFINVFKKFYFFNKDSLKLRAIKNKHAKDSFGIEICYSKKKIFYSSDTVFVPKMLKGIEHMDYLIHDCTASSFFFKKHPSLYNVHTNSKQLLDYLKDKPDIKLIPIHFLFMEQENIERIRKELKPLGNQVIWVKDGQKIQI
jgi:ribonuclease BN (tRNA processing enzyme)